MRGACACIRVSAQEGEDLKYPVDDNTGPVRNPPATSPADHQRFSSDVHRLLHRQRAHSLDAPASPQTPQALPRSDAAASAAEEAVALRALNFHQVGELELGFYEWVEYLARAGFILRKGAKEGAAWAMDRLLITAVPDDVAVLMLPRECYGEGGPDPALPPEVVAAQGKPPPKQPETWDVRAAGPLPNPIPPRSPPHPDGAAQPPLVFAASKTAPSRLLCPLARPQRRRLSRSGAPWPSRRSRTRATRFASASTGSGGAPTRPYPRLPAPAPGKQPRAGGALRIAARPSRPLRLRIFRRELFAQHGTKLLRVYLAYSYERPVVIEAAHEAAPGPRTVNFNQVLRMFDRMARGRGGATPRCSLMTTPTEPAAEGLSACLPGPPPFC